MKCLALKGKRLGLRVELRQSASGLQVECMWWIFASGAKS